MKAPAGRYCHMLATAETIRRSIRAVEAANRAGDLPRSSVRQNLDILSTLRTLLEVRR